MRLTPENFERLVLNLARQTLAVEHAQLYGVRGQKQHGIDLYCRLVSSDKTEPRYVTIQCRNVTRITPSTLGAAVDEFLKGTWADRTEIFIFATRASTQRTELAEAVESQARRLGARQICFEVWDGEQLSRQLRDQPDLVELFFGQATAEIYCKTTLAAPTMLTDRDGPSSQLADRAAPWAKQPMPLPSLSQLAMLEPSATPLPGRWRIEHAGAATVGLSNGLKDIVSPHRDSYRPADADTPPSVRIGIRIASEPLPTGGPSTSQIRRRFLGLLTRPPVSEIVAALTSAATTETWESHGDGRRTHHAAILVSEAATGAPPAWARLQLPTSNQLTIGWDPRCAGFILHIDWTTSEENTARSPVDLRRWKTIMNKALSLPAAIATYLTDELAMQLGTDPMPALGFWLSTSSDLTQVIDTDGLARISGSHTSRWYDAYAVADNEGQPASVVAKSWVTQLCDDALHLDGYENAI